MKNSKTLLILLIAGALFSLIPAFGMEPEGLYKKGNLLVINSSISPITLHFSKPHRCLFEPSFLEANLHCFAQPANKGTKEIELPVGKKILILGISYAEPNPVWFYTRPATPSYGMSSLGFEALRAKFGLMPPAIELVTEKGWTYNSIARKVPASAEQDYETVYKLIEPFIISPETTSTLELASPESAPLWSKGDQKLDAFKQKGLVTGQDSFSKNGGAVSVYRYNPPMTQLSENTKPVALFLVHGTWAKESEEFTYGHEFFQDVLNFAQSYADEKRAPIDVITFGWTGENNTNSRVKAADQLAKLINTFYQNHELLTVAHSHGGSVVNRASQLVEKPLNLMIHLGVPVREATDAQLFFPQSFNRLMNFYSTGDAVAPFGAIDTSMLTGRGSIRKFGQQEDKEVVNIRTLIDSYDPTHTQIKYIMKMMYPIVKEVEQYKLCTDLDMNVDFAITTATPVLATIRNPKACKILLAAPAEELRENEAQIEREQKLSDKNKKLFQDRFGKNIAEKPPVWKRIFTAPLAEARQFIPSSKN